MGALASKLRGPVFRYSEWSICFNNVGCSATLKTNFEINIFTKSKQGNFPLLSIYKNDDQTQLSNYSQISFLPTIFNIFETKSYSNICISSLSNIICFTITLLDLGKAIQLNYCIRIS